MGDSVKPPNVSAASPPTTSTSEECSRRLKKHIEMESKGLAKIIKGELLIPSSTYVERAANIFTNLVKPGFGCAGSEIAMNLTILTLYDIVILIDDSFSMKNDPELLPSLESLIEQICEIYEFANPGGINSIRFMNHHVAKKGVKKADVKNILSLSPYTGVSRIGTELQRRVLDTFVLAGAMTKPLLVLTFTDGVIEGEEIGLLTKVIMRCLSQIIPDPEKGGEAVAFQFICLGEDKSAQKFLQCVDDHEKIGHRVDCVLPAYHQLHTIHDDDLWNGRNGRNGRKWPALSKILLGALLANFDNHDEELEIDLSGLDLSIFDGEQKRPKNIAEDN